MSGVASFILCSSSHHFVRERVPLDKILKGEKPAGCTDKVPHLKWSGAPRAT
jgi:hypothetical protein